MPKRKKHPKLPNGFGSIRYLGSGRKNPYCVQPPAQGLDLRGQPVRPAPLCYVSDWYIGFAVLTAYNAGKYYSGIERDVNIPKEISCMDDAVKHIMADYSQLTQKITGKSSIQKRTFEDVYNEFFAYKFEQDKNRTYSQSTIFCTKAAFKNLSILHAEDFRSIRFQTLQNTLDESPCSHASLEHMLSLLHQIYAFAETRDYVDKDYSVHLKINALDDEEHGVPFTEEDIRILWSHKEDPIVEMILIMIYSGFRITAYLTINVDLKGRYFKGGVKTRASKDRIVPIHSAILPLVSSRVKRTGNSLLGYSVDVFRNKMKQTLSTLNIETHTPHDCRHTFSMLCEKYGVKENDRKRMLGHSFGNDITNRVYGHRTVEELRNEIEKIKLPEHPVCD